MPDGRARTPNPRAGKKSLGESLCDALPQPLLAIGPDHAILFANLEAQVFFSQSVRQLRRKTLPDILPFASTLLELVAHVRRHGSSVFAHDIDPGTPHTGPRQTVNALAAPLPDDPAIVLLSIQVPGVVAALSRQDRQKMRLEPMRAISRGLAHEIRNPLAGIRGAAQLIGSDGEGEHAELGHLIVAECDRVVRLLNTVCAFDNETGPHVEAVNVHSVLHHVKRVAAASFGLDVEFVERYDPSLPPARARHDRLVELFFNLVKNACEALEGRAGARIVLSSAFRPGRGLRSGAERQPALLPLEYCVEDNGPGVEAAMRDHLFEPFATTRRGGSGLGLALAAKLVDDFAGDIDCVHLAGGTRFCVRLAIHEGGDKRTVAPPALARARGAGHGEKTS